MQMYSDRYYLTEERVLVLGLLESNLNAARDILSVAGFTVECFADPACFCDELKKGAGVCLVFQDSLNTHSVALIKETLRLQPSWSDISIIAVLSKSTYERPVVRQLRANHNITVVQMPLRMISLITLISSMLTARKRQYQHRDILNALSESEERLRALVTASSEVLYRMSPDWSEMIYLGGGKFLTDTEQPTRNWINNYIHTDDQPHVLEAIQHSIRTKSIFELEHRVWRADGTLGWTLSRAVPLLDDKGQIREWFGAANDVTARKKAEETLRASEARFKMISEYAPVLLDAFDEQGRCVLWNKEAEKVFGWTLEEINAHANPLALFYPDPEIRKEVVETLTSKPERVFREWHPLAKDGSELICLWANFKLPDGMVINVGYDITERKKAEELLLQRTTEAEEGKRLVDTILQYTPVGLTILQADTRIRAISGSALALIGRTREEIDHFTLEEIKEFWQVLLPEKGKLPLDELPVIEAMTEGRTVKERELAIMSKNGKVTPVLATAAPIKDGQGQTTGGIIAWQDISERKRAEEALRQSHARLKKVLEVETVGVLFWDLTSGRLIDANDTFLKLTGYSRRELESGELSWQKFTPPEYVEISNAAVRDCLEIGRFGPYEKEYIRKDGTRQWFTFAGSLIDNNIAVEFCVDITKRKRAETALRESQQRFESFMRHLPGASFMKDLAGRYIYVNPELTRIFGKHADDILGKTDADLLPSEAASHFQENDSRALQEGSVDTVERLRQPDGLEHHSIVSKFIVPGPDDKPAYIGGVAFDITERIKAEDALRESEARFRGAFENAAVGMTQVDLNGNWMAVNQRFCNMTGYSKEALIGTDFMILTHPDDIETDHHRFAQLIHGDVDSYFVTKRYIRKDGTVIWTDLYRALQRDANNKPVYTISIVIDITDRKRAEETLKSFRDQLESKNRELESIIGIVSHDLRAPLVNIQGFSNELKMDYKAVDTLLGEVPVERKVESQLDKLLHKNIPESLQYIQSSSEAMNNLVRTLIETARAGLTPVKPEVIDMDELIYKILESIKIKVKEADVTYDVTALPDCYADKQQVAQIFTNLLDNAVKYLDPSRPGQICIEGTCQTNQVLYWVSDNGIGIPPDEQEKIFEPYYQLKEKASVGIGMGLATVKKLVDRNNGKIWVVSEKGKYSIFYVALPRK